MSSDIQGHKVESCLYPNQQIKLFQCYEEKELEEEQNHRNVNVHIMK